MVPILVAIVDILMSHGQYEKAVHLFEVKVVEETWHTLAFGTKCMDGKICVEYPTCTNKGRQDGLAVVSFCLSVLYVQMRTPTTIPHSKGMHGQASSTSVSGLDACGISSGQPWFKSITNPERHFVSHSQPAFVATASLQRYL